MKKFVFCLAFAGLTSLAAPATAEAAVVEGVTITCNKDTGRTTTTWKDGKGRTHIIVRDSNGRVVY
ncbi:hypothetical protein NP234_24305, partial [Salmonella enterica]|nr:hypothetical protein [Salmonella enterica]